MLKIMALLEKKEKNNFQNVFQNKKRKEFTKYMEIKAAQSCMFL